MASDCAHVAMDVTVHPVIELQIEMCCNLHERALLEDATCTARIGTPGGRPLPVRAR